LKLKLDNFVDEAEYFSTLPYKCTNLSSRCNCGNQEI